MCGEWEFGGFPAWLIDIQPPITIRTYEPGYITEVGGDPFATDLIPTNPRILNSVSLSPPSPIHSVNLWGGVKNRPILVFLAKNTR